MRPQKHYFLRHSGASNMASTKARLLKHDFPVHGLIATISLTVLSSMARADLLKMAKQEDSNSRNS